jgi:hypothetical protein
MIIIRAYHKNSMQRKINFTMNNVNTKLKYSPKNCYMGIDHSLLKNSIVFIIHLNCTVMFKS